MKSSITFLIILAIVVCCTGGKQSDELSSDSTVAVNSDSISKIIGPFSPWIIPLTSYWKDREHFVLLIPDPEFEVYTDFLNEPEFTKYEQVRKDTIQGRILQRKPTTENCGEQWFYQVEVGNDKKRGWVVHEQVYTIDQLDLGTYTVNGRTLKLGVMKLRSKMDEGACYNIQTLFFYDDTNLYLIDSEGAEFEVKWRQQKHVSIVSQVQTSPAGKTDGNQFVINWGEPMVTVELRIAWVGDHLKFQSHQVNNLDSDVGDIEMSEAEEKGVGAVHMETCVLEDASMGDCNYLTFSCGDFGDAEIDDSMPEKEKELWNKLTIEKDGVAVNPEYKGKTFVITYFMAEGDVCGDPSAEESKGSIPYIVGLKLK